MRAKQPPIDAGVPILGGQKWVCPLCGLSVGPDPQRPSVPNAMHMRLGTVETHHCPQCYIRVMRNLVPMVVPLSPEMQEQLEAAKKAMEGGEN